jgi:predicted ATPase with chaperone activity
LLERIDIHIEVPAVKYKELRAPSSSEDSAAVRQRVIDGRNRQAERYRDDKKTYSNAQMMPKMIRSLILTPRKTLSHAISARQFNTAHWTARTGHRLTSGKKRNSTGKPGFYRNNGPHLQPLLH